MAAMDVMDAKTKRQSRRELERMRRLRKRARDRNYRFRRMSPEQQRVRIAKDVIEQLDAKRFVAYSGEYVKVTGCSEPSVREAINHPAYGARFDDDLSEVLSGVEACQVCALGSIFVAAVERNDDITVGEVGRFNAWRGLTDYLVRWFSLEQLMLMEAAFERLLVGSAGFPSERERPALAQAVEFGERYGGPYRFEQHGIHDEPRLRAIMQNIIDNGGTFVPTDLRRVPGGQV